MADTASRPDIGDKAPDFDLPAAGAENVKLSALSGKAVVLFFYPKDDTSGCTAEAIDFTAALPDFQRLDVKVIGMSPDPVKKHDKFREKHGLQTVLVSDEEKKTLSDYGVWVEKSMYGRKYMGVERSTFLIAADGTILKAWRKVKVPGHVADVLKAAKELV
ncbi:peroxiredoxin [Salaquimonas pukyongi]|uniref:peroxiredoxin n=1 Tax=Salaquimonas pukyongi TaxID=2712698 RepID=UPI00096B9A12|nr:peroxiredoxin [Salaquimonas pukyongi]